MTPPWPHGDPRDVVRSIVADPRYAALAAPRPTPRGWLDYLHDWVARLLRTIFHGLDHALGARNPLGAVIGTALIVATFALLGYCVFRLVRSFGRNVIGPQRSPGHETLASSGPNAAALRDAATVAARGGRYRDAAALLFTSAVRVLDERGHIAYDPARTPGEYRRIIRDPLFDTFAADAVVAVFAATEPRGELFDRMSGTYDRFFAARPR